VNCSDVPASVGSRINLIQLHRDSTFYHIYFSIKYMNSQTQHVTRNAKHVTQSLFIAGTYACVYSYIFLKNILECGTQVWNTSVGRKCGTQVWNTSVEHKCGTQVWNTSVGRKCGTQVWDASVEHKCGTQVWNTSVGRKCGTQVWDASVSSKLASFLDVGFSLC
jgi:hypothetical protein